MTIFYMLLMQISETVLLFTHDESVRSLFSSASFYRVEDGIVRRV
jgi:hypothetical protein